MDHDRQCRLWWMLERWQIVLFWVFRLFGFCNSWHMRIKWQLRLASVKEAIQVLATLVTEGEGIQAQEQVVILVLEKLGWRVLFWFGKSRGLWHI
jgi:hypothetical protein